MAENRKHDRDEILIMHTLNKVPTPHFDILEGMKRKMKTRTARKKAPLLVMVAIMLLLLGTTALAAQHFGSFDRLRGIIGDEAADDLTPIQIASEDPNQTVLYDGIRVELVAASITDNVVDVYFTLEDTTGNRLHNTFDMANSVTPVDREFPIEALTGSFGRTEIIDRDESGVVTVHARHEFGQSVEGLELTFWLSAIYFDTQDEQFAPIVITLADFLSNSESMLYQYENPDPWGTSMQVFMDGDFMDDGHWERIRALHDQYVEQIRNEGFPMLTPSGQPISLAPHFSLADARASISAIGVIGDRLHVQLMQPDSRVISEAGWSGNSRLALFNGSMDELQALLDERQHFVDLGYMPWEIDTTALWNHHVNPYLEIMFFMDDASNIFHESTRYIDANGNSHHVHDPRRDDAHRFNEHIFDIDLANIHDYILVAHTFSEQVLPVGWSVSFNTHME
ncbi:MAG: hypothetical protein FWG38_00505 [Defluviitaleaceae bacterium]|nr:hypothetical protein [Defluviitaleaceae bacterium]